MTARRVAVHSAPSAPSLLPVNGHGRTRAASLAESDLSTMTVEQRFELVWPRWQPPGEGLVAVATQPEATLGWADALLARQGSDLYVWSALDTDASFHGLSIVERSGVVAASLVGPRDDARHVDLALKVALQLTSQQGEGLAWGRPPGACLTTWSAPVTQPGIVRVPHLVTVHRGGAASDTVVWQLMSVAAAHSWFGTPLPDLGYVESHLDALLRLRSRVREGRLPAVAAKARALHGMSGHGFSIELVYRHLGLFRMLLDTSHQRPSQSTGGEPWS